MQLNTLNQGYEIYGIDDNGVEFLIEDLSDIDRADRFGAKMRT